MSKDKRFGFDYMGKTRTVAEFVEAELDGRDYGGGQLETLERSVEKMRRAFALLIRHLQQTGMTEQQVEDIVRGRLPNDSSVGESDDA